MCHHMGLCPDAPASGYSATQTAEKLIWSEQRGESNGSSGRSKKPRSYELGHLEAQPSAQSPANFADELLRDGVCLDTIIQKPSIFHLPHCRVESGNLNVV